MRIWHKDLLSVLPQQQLLGQWRECCLIAKNIAEKSTPNHILVNRVMDYPLEHFVTYSYMVANEMYKRGYRINKSRFDQYYNLHKSVNEKELFKDWHTARYLRQCLYNLQEKRDAGGISQEEWNKIKEKFADRFDIIW